MEHSLPYLFGPHTINDGVEWWWDNQIEIGNKNVNIVGYVVSKSVAEEREEWGRDGRWREGEMETELEA